MKKVAIILLLNVLGVQSISQNQINNCKVEVLEVNRDEIDFIQDQMYQVKITQNQKTTFTKEFIKLQEDGDCSSTQMDMGKLTLKNDTLTYYRYMNGADRMPMAYYHFGAVKSTYVLDSVSGKFKEINSKMYVHEYVYEDPEVFGDNAEICIEETEEAIGMLEQMYGAKMIDKSEASDLINEVKKAIYQDGIDMEHILVTEYGYKKEDLYSNMALNQ